MDTRSRYGDWLATKGQKWHALLSHMDKGKWALLRRYAPDRIEDLESEIRIIPLWASLDLLSSSEYSVRETRCWQLALLCASLLAKQSLLPSPTVAGKGIGYLLGTVAKKSSSVKEPLERPEGRRLLSLLFTPFEELPFKLRQTIRYLAANEMAPDFVVLWYDLYHWDSPERTIQKRWMREFLEAVK